MSDTNFPSTPHADRVLGDLFALYAAASNNEVKHILVLARTMLVTLLQERERLVVMLAERQRADAVADGEGIVHRIASIN